MTLLREIQDAASGSTTSLSDLLRRCKVLAARLKHQEFSDWLSKELNGYADDDDVPEYRRIAVVSLGQFSGPFGSGAKNVPIPGNSLPKKLRAIAGEHTFRESVGALTAFADSDSGSLKGKWSADIVQYLQHNHEMIQGMVLVDAWRVLPTAKIKGILDTVRTRVLDFVLAIEAADPSAGDVQPGELPRVPQEAVTTIYNHTVINGGMANIGTLGDARIETGRIKFSPSVPVHAREQVAEHLKTLREQLVTVPDETDRREASDALAHVESQLSTDTPRLDRMKKYLELYATIVTVAAPTIGVLQQVLQSIFG